MKPVVRALAESGVAPTIVFTGQHPGLSAHEFGLDRYGAVRLGEPGREDPHVHVGAVTRALQPILLRDPPDLLMVQGDTSSALGAALAAFTSGVPVAHVEAGLRTHDPLLPWPEEEYRVAIDADADLLFAPTEVSAGNLRMESVRGEIHVTGNTGIDAAIEAKGALPTFRLRERGRKRILVTCHRRESWNEGLVAIASALVDIATDGVDVELVLHPNPFVSERMRSLLADVPRVRLTAPCGHEELLGRIWDSDLVLSDSGGIQEEAPVLGVPLLILREKTERPEGIAAGASRLVGTDRAQIVREVRDLLADPSALARMTQPSFPFGDGHAGRRIASIVVDWLKQRSLTRRLA